MAASSSQNKEVAEVEPTPLDSQNADETLGMLWILFCLFVVVRFVSLLSEICRHVCSEFGSVG